MHTLGWALFFCSIAALLHHWLHLRWIQLPSGSGGAVGAFTYNSMKLFFNSAGGNLLLIACALIGFTLATGFSWLAVAEKIGYYFWLAISWLARRSRALVKLFFAKSYRKIVNQLKRLLDISNPLASLRSWRATRLEAKALAAAESKRIATIEINKARSGAQDLTPKLVQQQLRPEAASATKPVKATPALHIGEYPQPIQQVRSSLGTRATGEIPAISLLDAIAERPKNALSKEILQERSRELELKLADFNVNAEVVAVHPGPVVTRFELELAAGTKVSKITGLVKDIARSLSVISVRVVEVIPGKSAIGIELPNAQRETVCLREVLASEQYDAARSALTLGLGKDIAGNPVVVDLAKMPHLLVAGTTGSGKSVSLNAMLLSLLYKATPRQLRLIMIDPKMLELSIYADIPHLLVPVVTDMKEASNALRWCVVEMERRYRLMASLGVRNVAGFNEKVVQARASGKPLPDPLLNPQADQDQPMLDELPQIVILADEFADMMMVVGKKIETLIARLAQKARAAGIHLILATQRPSVDVITGLIKANIPTRIAFQVSSRIDSRTILDQQGAEQLLGHGDMLYLPPGSGVPVRVHGAYVSDDEVHRVVDYLRKTGTADYVEEILTDPGQTNDPVVNAAFADENTDPESDALYDQAVEFVTQSRRASVSGVQRRFKIGYNRAARLVEQMEAAGIVSAMDGSSPREVLAPAPPER